MPGRGLVTDAGARPGRRVPGPFPRPPRPSASRPSAVIPSARGRAGGPRARSRSGARLIRLLPAPSTLPRREPGFAPRHQVNSRPPASSETPDGGRARTRAFETQCDDGVRGGGGCEHLSRLRGRREAPWAGAGGSGAPLCFPKATLPAACVLCQADASVWLQGLGRGWFLLRRKRVVNRPTVTVTGIVDADPNALPGPRHDGEAGLSAPARPQPPCPAARRPPSRPVSREAPCCSPTRHPSSSPSPSVARLPPLRDRASCPRWPEWLELSPAS